MGFLYHVWERALLAIAFQCKSKAIAGRPAPTISGYEPRRYRSFTTIVSTIGSDQASDSRLP